MHWLMSLQLALRKELLWTLHALVFLCIRIMLPVMIIESALISEILLADTTIKRDLL